MKVKFDFISNSSSTSFVYIGDEEFNEELFFEAVGVDKDGFVGELFYQMYLVLCSTIKRHGTLLTSKDAVDQLSNEHSFTPEVIEKIKEAIEQGKRVVTSTLDSGDSLAESFLCTAIFEIESDSFYINAYDNVW